MVSEINSKLNKKIFKRKVCKRAIELHVKHFYIIKLHQIFIKKYYLPYKKLLSMITIVSNHKKNKNM